MGKLNLEAVNKVLAQSDVEFAGLFGSQASDTADSASDVDILVKFKKPQGLIKIVGLREAISQALRKKVDLVTEQSLSPYIRESVMNSLQVFYGKR